MDVIFETDTENRFTMQVDGYGTLYFNKGVFVTQDKELIKKLINHPLKERNEYRIVTNDEVVAKYLEGEESDKLTEEILDTVTRQGIIELGKELKSNESQPTLIKYEIIGEPITNNVSEIIDFYQIEKTKDEVLEDVEREEEKVSEVSNVVSTDMNASDAIEYIENTPVEELEGFVPEEEERVTVKRALEEKLGE